MYNDRHWLTDVAAGAGIGILYQNRLLVVSKMQKTTFQKETKRQL
jgi:hypothetical protein